MANSPERGKLISPGSPEMMSNSNLLKDLALAPCSSVPLPSGGMAPFSFAALVAFLLIGSFAGIPNVAAIDDVAVEDSFTLSDSEEFPGHGHTPTFSHASSFTVHEPIPTFAGTLHARDETFAVESSLPLADTNHRPISTRSLESIQHLPVSTLGAANVPDDSISAGTANNVAQEDFDSEFILPSADEVAEQLRELKYRTPEPDEIDDQDVQQFRSSDVSPRGKADGEPYGNPWKGSYALICTTIQRDINEGRPNLTKWCMARPWRYYCKATGAKDWTQDQAHCERRCGCWDMMRGRFTENQDGMPPQGNRGWNPDPKYNTKPPFCPNPSDSRCFFKRNERNAQLSETSDVSPRGGGIIPRTSPWRGSYALVCSTNDKDRREGRPDLTKYCMALPRKYYCNSVGAIVYNQPDTNCGMRCGCWDMVRGRFTDNPKGKPPFGDFGWNPDPKYNTKPALCPNPSDSRCFFKRNEVDQAAARQLAGSLESRDTDNPVQARDKAVALAKEREIERHVTIPITGFSTLVYPTHSRKGPYHGPVPDDGPVPPRYAFL
ncbi:MAG: hypothetical protein Q9227_008042 [Pyrenula ochraceoflavens]